MRRGYRINQRKPRSVAARLREAALADHIANGGTFAAFQRELGLSERGVRMIWKRVVAQVGAQAI